MALAPARQIAAPVRAAAVARRKPRREDHPAACRAGFRRQPYAAAPRALERLAARLAGGPYTVIAGGQPLPAFDLQCPLMSLPLAFGTTPETIPASVPYLTAAPDAVARWRARLATAVGMKIGLVWAGNPAPLNDRARSLALDRLPGSWH